jgi:hypothetical protein
MKFPAFVHWPKKQLHDQHYCVSISPNGCGTPVAKLGASV